MDKSLKIINDILDIIIKGWLVYQTFKPYFDFLSDIF